MAKNKIVDLDTLRKEVEPYGGVVRLLLDNAQQVRFLEDAQKARGHPKPWSAFVKVNGGYKSVRQLPSCAARMLT